MSTIGHTSLTTNKDPSVNEVEEEIDPWLID